jgi:polyisoprenoid-binding protein YceI
MKTINLMLAVLVSSTLAFAADKKTENKSASKSKDMTISKDIAGDIKWTGFGVGKSHAGTIQLKSGKIEMKNENIVGGTLVFDMKTLAADKFDYSEKLTGHLKSEDFFNTEKFDTATLKITKVSPLKSGPNAFEITGDLTIKDKTSPITFNTVVTKTGDVLKASGTAEIKDRTKYGIVYNSKQFATLSKLGDKLIEDNIKIDINVMTK